MNELNITEYAALTISGHGMEPSIVTRTVKFDESGKVSEVFSDRTMFIRILATADCRIAFGATPKAGIHATIIPSGKGEYFGVNKQHKLSVVKL